MSIANILVPNNLVCYINEIANNITFDQNVQIDGNLHVNGTITPAPLPEPGPNNTILQTNGSGNVLFEPLSFAAVPSGLVGQVVATNALGHVDWQYQQNPINILYQEADIPNAPNNIISKIGDGTEDSTIACSSTEIIIDTPNLTLNTIPSASQTNVLFISGTGQVTQQVLPSGTPTVVDNTSAGFIDIVQNPGGNPVYIKQLQSGSNINVADNGTYLTISQNSTGITDIENTGSGIPIIVNPGISSPIEVKGINSNGGTITVTDDGTYINLEQNFSVQNTGGPGVQSVENPGSNPTNIKSFYSSDNTVQINDGGTYINLQADNAGPTGPQGPPGDPGVIQSVNNTGAAISMVENPGSNTTIYIKDIQAGSNVSITDNGSYVTVNSTSSTYPNTYQNGSFQNQMNPGLNFNYPLVATNSGYGQDITINDASFTVPGVVFGQQSADSNWYGEVNQATLSQSNSIGCNLTSGVNATYSNVMCAGTTDLSSGATINNSNLFTCGGSNNPGSSLTNCQIMASNLVSSSATSSNNIIIGNAQDLGDLPSSAVYINSSMYVGIGGYSSVLNLNPGDCVLGDFQNFYLRTPQLATSPNLVTNDPSTGLITTNPIPSIFNLSLQDPVTSTTYDIYGIQYSSNPFSTNVQVDASNNVNFGLQGGGNINITGLSAATSSDILYYNTGTGNVSYGVVPTAANPNPILGQIASTVTIGSNAIERIESADNTRYVDLSTAGTAKMFVPASGIIDIGTGTGGNINITAPGGAIEIATLSTTVGSGIDIVATSDIVIQGYTPATSLSGTLTIDNGGDISWAGSGNLNFQSTSGAIIQNTGTGGIELECGSGGLLLTLQCCSFVEE